MENNFFEIFDNIVDNLIRLRANMGSELIISINEANFNELGFKTLRETMEKAGEKFWDNGRVIYRGYKFTFINSIENAIK